MLPNGPLGGGAPSPRDVPQPKKPGESPLGGRKIKETTGESVPQSSLSIYGRNTKYPPEAKRIAYFLGHKCTEEQAEVFLDQARKYPGKSVSFKAGNENGELSYDAKARVYTIKKAKLKPRSII